MQNYEENELKMMYVGDSLKGIVRGQNSWGLFIDLQVEGDVDGEYKKSIPVFGYWGGKVPKGTEVTCSVKRWAKEDKNILVTIDSVKYGSDMGRVA